MKKIISCLLVCLLLFTANAAFAVDSADVFVNVGNPRFIYNGEEVLNVPSAWFDFNTFVTDTGLMGILARLRKDEKTIALGKAFIDENGLTFTADGIKDMYTVDVESQAGVNLFDVLKEMPLFTQVSAIEYDKMPSLNEGFKLDDLLANMTDNGDGTYSYTITKEMSKAFMQYVEDDDDESFEGVITLTPTGGNSFTAEGVINYTSDDGVTPIKMTLENNEGNGRLVLTSDAEESRVVADFTTDADGKFSLELRGEEDAEVEVFATFESTHTAEGSEYVLRILDEEQETVDLTLTATEDGFNFSVQIMEDGRTETLEMSWKGQTIRDDAIIGYEGVCAMRGDIDGESFDFSANMQFGYSTLNSEQWYDEDTSNAIDIEHISDEQMAKLSGELMIIGGRITVAFGDVIGGLMHAA